jgi:ABC-2 type transport system permease protein
MHSFYANTLNETEKIWKRRRTKGFLLLTLFFPLLTALLLAMLQNAGSFGGLECNLPMLMLKLFTFAVLPLYLFMTAADSFAGEAAARTLKLALVRPITRAKAYASKVAAISLWTIVQLASLWTISTLSGWAVPGGSMAGGLPDSAIAYAAAIVPMLAIGIVAVFTSQWFTSSTGAMAIAIGIYAAAKLLVFLSPKLSVWSVFSYTNWYALWVGNGASIGKLGSTFVLLVSYSIMAYIAGLILFERKQL